MKKCITGPEFKCEVCPYVTEQANNLKRHKGKHQKEKKEKEIICCKQCDKTFQFKHHLTQHIKTHSKSQMTEKGNFSCTLCSSTFNYKYNLTRHVTDFHKSIVKSELGFGVFVNVNKEDKESNQCDKCSYSTKRSNDLIKHYKRRHEKSPYI